MFMCLQNRCSLLNCSEALPSREFRFGVCVAVWLHVIPKSVAVLTLFTGVPSRNSNMCLLYWYIGILVYIGIFCIFGMFGYLVYFGIWDICITVSILSRDY